MLDAGRCLVTIRIVVMLAVSACGEERAADPDASPSGSKSMAGTLAPVSGGTSGGNASVVPITSGSADAGGDSGNTGGAPGGDPPCTPAGNWTRQFGTAAQDTGAGIATDGLGAVYVTGVTEGVFEPPGPPTDRQDVFITKYDAEGTTLWTRQVSAPSRYDYSAVAVDASGAVYVTGTTEGDLDGNVSAGLEDAFLAKYDAAGTKLWTRQLGTAGQELGTGVTVDTSGGIYVTGSTNGRFEGSIPATSTEAFLAKYDAAGKQLWVRQFGAAPSAEGFGVTADASGAVYVTGRTRGDLDGNVGAGNGDAFLVKYDSAGERLWTRLLGTPSADGAYAVATDGMGAVYMTGTTYGALDGAMSADGDDMFVAKYDDAGEKQWTRQLGTMGTNVIGRSVAADNAGGIYVAAYLYYVTGYAGGGLDGHAPVGMTEALLAKYDDEGTKQWTQQHSTPDDDVAVGVTTDRSGRVYVVGYTNGDLDGHGSAGLGDTFVLRLCP